MAAQRTRTTGEKYAAQRSGDFQILTLWATINLILASSKSVINDAVSAASGRGADSRAIGDRFRCESMRSALGRSQFVKHCSLDGVHYFRLALDCQDAFPPIALAAFPVCLSAT
jgi:hypothetical protein